MNSIKLPVISSFLTSRKYWNSRNFDYRTCQHVPHGKITPFPVIDTSNPTLDKLRDRSEQRYIFSPRSRLK